MVNWKLVSDARNVDAAKLKRTQFELYNLAADISEQSDVAQDNPEETKRLFGEFRKFTQSRRLK